MNKMRMSKSIGRELSNDWTSTLIPGMELMVLRGLKILMTLIADTFEVVKNDPIHPMITTKKSNYTRLTEYVPYSKYLTDKSEASLQTPLQ
jgi:hypothetical protein